MDQIPEINTTKEAGHVYLLMQDEYRISRNARASWYFNHLNKGITPDPPGSADKELQVLSVVPKFTDQSTEEEEEEGEGGHHSVNTPCYHVTPTTIISFLAKKYRFVFVLDLSPSLASVDLTSEEVLLDELYRCLCAVVTSLLNPFQVPGSQVVLEPDIYVTVVGHTPLINCRSNQVLVQGCHLTRDNVEQVLEQVAVRLKHFENEIARSMADVLGSERDDASDGSQKLLRGSLEDLDARDIPVQAFHLMSPDSSFINMLRYGMLALHLLNENSASGIIVLTDGIVGSPDAALFESLMLQLRHNSIAVSFLQVGDWQQPQVALGQVPYNELMQFIATATFGSYFTKIRDKVTADTLEMNVYQLALLTWSFQRALTGLKVDGWQVETYEQLNENLAWTHRIPTFGENRHIWATPLMRKKHTDRNLHTALPHLISCRLREGYTIKQVTISGKGEGQIEVQLVLPWRDKVWIHYEATSSWPFNAGKRHTHVEVTIEGSYAFLHDVTCPQKKPFKSPYRAAVVKKYWQTLQGMLESDQLLVHLQSFSSNPNYYKVPDSVQKGVPLFYLPPHDNSPQVNIQLNSKDPLVAQFASFWKPMLMLDVNIWQKWMHTHRIGLILEHDKPVGKHLHTPNSSGRFHTVTCRQAQLTLNGFLSEVSTFVLMENHSYISLIFDDPDSSPTSFYVLRVVHKPPCLVLRLAFLGGTSGQQRYKIVADLLEGIGKLMFPRRGTAKSEKTKKESPAADPLATNRLQRTRSETPCCLIMTKPIEKILMRYERVPYDFLAFELPQQLEQTGLSLPVSAVNRAASSVFMTLSRYLYHRRWVWSVQSSASQPMTMQAIGRILSNLTKIRLQEGFLFANASSGIINMIAEVEMMQEYETPETESLAEADGDVDEDVPGSKKQTHPCVIQYLIFPPHTTTLAESLDEDEQEAPEADREQQIITEVWVEPQHGRVVNSPPERQHFDCIDYKQLAVATLPTDLECISTMVTFEYLNLMCQNTSVPSPLCASSLPVHPSPALIDQHPEPPDDQEATVQRKPFAFDLMKVLSKCQQAELLFSMFTQDEAHCECGLGSAAQPTPPEATNNEMPNTVLLDQFLHRMEEAHDRELKLQDQECQMLRDLILQRPRDHTANPLPLRTPQSKSSPNIKSARSCSEQANEENITAEPSSYTSDGEGTARWRCFIKSVNFTHIILSFVPATLDDLCTLVHTPPEEQQKDILIEEKGVNDATEEDSQDDRCEHEQVPPDAPQGEDSQEPCSRAEDTHVEGHKDEGSVDEPATPESGGKESPSAESLPDSLSHKSPMSDVDSPPQHGDEDIYYTKSDNECSGPKGTPQPTQQQLSPNGETDPPPVSPKEEKQEVTNEKEPVREAEKASPISLVIPVYVYNCPLYGLTEQLLSRSSSLLQQDIYQDLTTKPDMCCGELRHSLTDDGSGTAGEGPHRSRVDSETIRDKIRQSAEERPEAGSGGGAEFRHQLSLINEHYHRSFVIGVYNSLLAGYNMHCEDVDAVINGICEESLPIEMNITRYLHNTCGHIRKLVERAKIEQMMREDTAKIVPNTVPASTSLEQKDDVFTEADPHPDCSPTDADDKPASPLVLPGSPRRAVDGFGHPDNTPVQLPLSLLTSKEGCEAAPSLHSLIQRKFSQIISQYFKPVPAHPEFFYYYPMDSKSKWSTSNLDTTGGAINTSATSDSREPEAEMYREDVFNSDVDDACPNVDSECDIDSLGSESDVESNLSDLRNPPSSTHDVPPLFIHLICSVRTKGRALRSMAIRNLPTCLGDLRACLKDVTGSIDLNDLQVTIDVICLTLPSEQEFSEYMERPPLQRMTSYSSQASHFSAHAIYEREDTLSFNGKLTKEVHDSLRCLSPDQLLAVNACKDEVMWLLRDEIASALRQTVPVTSETLQMVANHVGSSEGKQCCITRRVPLQFVYGPEQSLTHFIQSFERMELPGYLLNKEYNYYYLLLDHARANNLAHFKAVSSALHDLYTDSKTFVAAASREVGAPSPHQGNTATPVNIATQENTASPANTAIPANTATPVNTATQANTSTQENTATPANTGTPVNTATPANTATQANTATPEKEVPATEGKLVTDMHVSGTDAEKAPVVNDPELGRTEPNVGDVSKNINEKEGEFEQLAVATGSLEVSPEEVMHTKVTSPKEDCQTEGVQLFSTTEPLRSSSAAEESPRVGDDIKISVIRPSPVKEFKGNTEKVSSLAEVLFKETETEGILTTVEGATSKATTEVQRTLHFVGVDSESNSPEPPHYEQLTLASLTEKGPVKRTSSAVSLDKLRGANLALNSSNPQTPNRSRHQSGLQTPMSGSVLDAMSQGSIEEEGYDGGSSDSDEEGVMMSFSESMLRYRQLPDFWLIMEIKQDRVDVYFHTRDTGDKPTSWIDQQQLFENVISIISKKCRTVNQWLLLQDLSKTRQCNQLLVPEADEDVQWPGEDKTASVNTRHKMHISGGDSEDSDSETAHGGRYLEAALHVRPGYFACDCVWQKEFVLHPRLKTDPRRIGSSRGVQVLKNSLETFAVVNRKNMFVIQENLSGPVFYLRLEYGRAPRHNSGQSVSEEVSPSVKPDDDVPLSVSRSSSLLSLSHKTKVPETVEEPKAKPLLAELTPQKSLVDGDDDPLQSSQNMRSTESLPEGSIILTAYGIGNVGPYISQELVNMLQKRLDTDMLQLLVGLFARNPMFKLMPEDVKFLQPEGSSPKQVVQLTIPPAAMLHQHALGHYLHQNLLQFLHTPKFADPGPENVFRDYTLPGALPIPENQVFLCSTRPQHAGGKGMSFIHLSFVDGKGSPVQLMASPKPSSNAYKDKLDPPMFESMINTQVYVPSPGSKGPGPAALVQFSLWERGESDSQLMERLARAMKHAVCDIVMEYRLLTAPLCDVPSHYITGIDSPMHSAPQSPVTHFISAADQRSYSGSPASDGSKKVTDGGRTPKEKTVFTLPAIFKSKSASKDSPKGSPSLSQTWHTSDTHRLREMDLRQKIQKYELGERGSLQPVFNSTMVDWFEFCTKLGAPAVQNLHFTLISRFPMEHLLREIQSIMGILGADVNLKVFRLNECWSSSHREHHPPVYLPYSTARPHQSSQEQKGESWPELPAYSQTVVPGKAADYMLVGRNVQQWRASIDYDIDEDLADIAYPRDYPDPLTGTYMYPVQKTLQRFLPLETLPSPGGEKQEIPTPNIQLTEKSFVPRQRLILATIKDKQMTIYTYNWAQNLQGSLESQLTKAVSWHNARSNLLTSILSHKAGLFNLPSHKNDSNYLYHADLQSLVKYTNPPPATPQSRPRAVSAGQRPLTAHPSLGLLQNTFWGHKPAGPMQRSSYATLRDPLHRHGAQMLELKHSKKKEEEKNTILMQLYENWQQRMGPSHAPINETDLELLKTSSRMIHSVATPLLLSPHWRQKVLPKSASSRHDSHASDTARPRSRHSSGASIRSKRSDSMDSKKRVDSPDITANRQPTEEVWHRDLRSSFVAQYIQYLQSLGFVQVRTRSASPRRGARHLSGDVQPARSQTDLKQVIKPNYTYLQKTLPGGIMLLEVGFKEVFFCIYVYVFECSRLPIRSINPQLAVIFTDECEKFKDLTHLHSFAHDFHLRTVQSYISGRHPVLGQNYHLSGFLHDFIQYYPYAPSFSRNYVLSGVCDLPLATNNASTQLFRYMLEHDKLYGMRAIRMVPLVEEDQEMENEYALVKYFKDEAQMLAEKPAGYDVGLVITHDSGGPRVVEGDRPVLRLKYYVLLTSRKELFPKQTLERLGMVKSTGARQYPAGISMVELPVAGHSPTVHTDSESVGYAGGEEGGSSPHSHPPVVQYIGVRQETTNYLGYTNKHQAVVFNMLVNQAEHAREKIEEIVGSAMSQCRRDLLWQRMLLPGNVTEEEGRRKRRSEHDEGKEPYLTRLSFTEFQELLSIVTRVHLSEIDERLNTLENMNMTWYLSLVRVLRLQYSPSHQKGVSHRYFSSQDGHVQYVVVLNPNFLDTFMMLAVDNISNKTGLCAVYRERIPDQSHTPTNPNLQAFAVQTLMEGFVNTCFYHMWTGLL